MTTSLLKLLSNLAEKGDLPAQKYMNEHNKGLFPSPAEIQLQMDLDAGVARLEAEEAAEVAFFGKPLEELTGTNFVWNEEAGVYLPE